MRRLLIVLALLAPTPALVAQAPATPASAKAAVDPSRVAPDSPRAAMVGFGEAARSGDWKRAARYLSVPPERQADAPRLAERLKIVLDRRLDPDLERLSPEPGGERDDGLPGGLEEVGTLHLGKGRAQPIRLVPAQDDQGAFWAFSPATVSQIDTWYEGLEDRWIRELLESAGLRVLLNPGPYDILWWQWMALPLLLAVAWGLGRLFGLVTRTFLGRILSKTKTEWDDKLLARIAPPLTFAWGLILFHVGILFLGLAIPAERMIRSLVSAAGVIAFFWALWRSVDVLAEALLASRWSLESPSARNLIAIGSNLGKGFLAAAGVVAALASLGYQVATLLAGLGIGGLAFAFGAQKTIENLFGSLALAADQPFRVGDSVKVGDFVGTVESIGLRSTRFRTPDRTLISLPNGTVASMRLESYAARDRMRLATTIGIAYGSTREQMQQILAGFERVLRGHPRIWPGEMTVKFLGFGTSSLDVEIGAWFEVPTWAEFQDCRQEVLFAFMTVVEEAGTAFASPTGTVRLVDGRAAAGGSPDGRAQISPQKAAG